MFVRPAGRTHLGRGGYGSYEPSTGVHLFDKVTTGEKVVGPEEFCC